MIKDTTAGKMDTGFIWNLNTHPGVSRKEERKRERKGERKRESSLLQEEVRQERKKRKRKEHCRGKELVLSQLAV